MDASGWDLIRAGECCESVDKTLIMAVKLKLQVGIHHFDLTASINSCLVLRARAPYLQQPNCNISFHSCGQVDLDVQVQLDTNFQRTLVVLSLRDLFVDQLHVLAESE